MDLGGHFFLRHQQGFYVQHLGYAWPVWFFIQNKVDSNVEHKCQQDPAGICIIFMLLSFPLHRIWGTIHQTGVHSVNSKTLRHVSLLKALHSGADSSARAAHRSATASKQAMLCMSTSTAQTSTNSPFFQQCRSFFKLTHTVLARDVCVGANMGANMRLGIKHSPGAECPLGFLVLDIDG